MSVSRRSPAVRAAFVAAGLLLAATHALANPPEGKGKNKHKQQDAGETVSASGSVLISAGITAAVARQYAVESGVKMSGYKPLPPGIQKNLARGKPLPPGIAKKAAPQQMLGRLPQHAGYEWQMAGTDLVLVQIGTAIVADVLKDVFR